MTVHVVGNACLDTLYRLQRFPEPGETMVADGMAEDLGGKGLNQAVAAARAGARVHLFAAIGPDRPGEAVAERLAAEGIDAAGLVRLDCPTDRSMIQVDAAGENTIVSVTGCADRFAPPLGTDLDRALEAGDLLLMQGNLRISAVRECFALARGRGVGTVLNPSPIRDSYAAVLPLTDLLVVNRGEACRLGGDADPHRSAQALLRRGASAVVVTLGAAGASLVTADGRQGFPAPAVTAVDTAGAGDLLCGVLAGLLDRGVAIEAALPAAIRAAALGVARPGVLSSFPSRAEIDAILPASLARGGAER
ncbi:PfkB family carbohydrate kinase [Inquilinus sp. Marseille-Q2685]|uniref:PfkB family carbohydrate kinase n=1 Tax=Inquilinus sp. Marseille-Q2685 TaxID=2866581 RepID=UPI001CE418EA|nr:PfkB family carbohydrate kinase [Inquilinus sp. Marseille-Q2685]